MSLLEYVFSRKLVGWLRLLIRRRTLRRIPFRMPSLAADCTLLSGLLGTQVRRVGGRAKNALCGKYGSGCGLLTILVLAFEDGQLLDAQCVRARYTAGKAIRSICYEARLAASP
jgi:hypothetical protein